MAPMALCPSSRGAEDAHARDVVAGILRSRRLVPENAIWKSCIRKVLPGHIMKSFGAIAGAHAIDKPAALVASLAAGS